MRLTKRLIALLLAVLMLPIWNRTVAVAAETTQSETSDFGTLISNVNPLYPGTVAVDDFHMPEFPEHFDSTMQPMATYVSEAKAATQLRNYMKNRTESFTIYVTSSSVDAQAIVDNMLLKAVVHTGNAKEGDYLMWQWGRWDAAYARSWNGSAYNYTFNLVFVYYTTAAQERQVDTAVNSLINSLGVRNKSDYEKIKGVYDWICDNVTYDYANLYDEAYTRKFSAYAALIDRTAVCQGYALLFYRLMLELGIDARVISGISGGGPHGWNIVELEGLYYTVDSTWDAGMSKYNFFLVNTWNAVDHSRYLDYETWEFHEAYPMAAENYKAGTTAEKDPYIYIDYCGDMAAFTVMRDGTLTIGGEGATYDYYPDSGVGADNAPWQLWREHITKLVVEEGITYLGDSACYYMDALKTVKLPTSLTTIGWQVFEGCKALRTVKIPEGVTTINRGAFAHSGITKLTLPDTLIMIDDEAFRGCEKLKTVTIPDSVTYLGSFAFGSCASLENIYFLGDAPVLSSYLFEVTVVTAYYPKDNETWTKEIRQDYQGTVTWKAKQFAAISKQPEDAMVMEGETASVTLEAKGEGLAYQWYYCEAGSDTFRKTNSFTGPDYSVKMTEARNGRRVYCVVTDKYGATAKSDVVTLSMITEATILEEPQDAQAQLGQRAKTTVKAAGKGLTYQWYVKDVGGSFVKSSNTTATYSYVMTEAKTGRLAYCVIMDEEGNSVTTRTVSFNLAATITQQPWDAVALEGEAAAVSFTVLGDGLTYQWYYKNPGGSKFIPTNTFKSNTYSITMTAARDGRQVYCVVTDQYGNQVTTDVVTLRVSPGLKITGQPVSTQVKLGEVAKATVTAQGDGLTYQWYVKDVGGSFVKSSNSTASYSYKMTESKAGRQAYCVIKDSSGKTLKTDTVTFGLKVTLVTQPVSITVASGKTAKVTVNAVGDGLTYKWYFKNAGASKYSLTTTFTGSEYSIKMDPSRAGRSVYCVITDKYGNSVTTDKVTINMAN